MLNRIENKIMKKIISILVAIIINQKIFIMKKFILLSPVFLLFGIFTAQSQTDDYYPLVQEGKVWSVVFVDDCYGIENLKFTTAKMAFFGDTTIHDITYKKMYASTKEFPIFPHDWTLQNFMREDEDKKVWYKANPSSTEKLYYDFSLEIGDTLPANLGYGYPYVTGPVVVEDIIYKKMLNGEERKVWHLSTMCFSFLINDKEYWVEGIGSRLGVIFPISGELLGGLSSLLCVYENEELIFNTNFQWGECYLSNSIITENFDNQYQLKIYPNPSKNILYIESLENFDIHAISLINLQGQTVKHYEPNTSQLDISNITEGIYFIKLSSSKGDVIKKIIINE